jgi:hypothetical protein
MREKMLGEGLVSPEDLELFIVTDDVQDAVEHVMRYREQQDPSLPP